MTLTIDNIKINYSFDKCKKSDEYVLFLHGWSGSLKSFEALKNSLKANINTINLDLPGFGLSDDPSEDFTIYSYANLIYKFLIKLNIQKVSVIGHSFGGRVAIILSSMYTGLVSNLVLIDSAGLKPRFNFNTFYKIRLYKICKKLVKFKLINKEILNKFGSDDYKKLDKKAQKVFNRVVNEDLAYLLKNIASETLIIWGKEDKATPLYMGKKLNKKIKNSALIVFDKSGHYSYVEEPVKATLIIKSFLSLKE